MDAYTFPELRLLMAQRCRDARVLLEERSGRLIETAICAKYVADGTGAEDYDLALRVGLYFRLRLHLGATSLIGVEIAAYEPPGWDMLPPTLGLV